MTLSPALLVATARGLVGRRDSITATAFIHDVGHASHLNDLTRESRWPLPKVDTPDELWHLAEARAIGSCRYPTEGELYVSWSPTRRLFTHAGIVAMCVGVGTFKDGARYFLCVTIEGDTSANGSTGGGGINRVTRRLSPDRGDRFVRWVDLDGRRFATPVPEWEQCAALMEAAAPRAA